MRVIETAKSEHNENKTSNSTTLIEPIYKLIDKLIERQKIISSKLDLTLSLTIVDTLKKELESYRLLPVYLLTFDGNLTKWPKL